MTMKETNTYGILGTILWLLFIGGVYLLIQSLVIGVYAGINQSPDAGVLTQEQIEATMLELQFNGNVFAWATIVSGVICTLLVFLAAKLKKTSEIKNYLALHATKPSTFLWWGLIFIAFLILSEILSNLLGVNSVPKEMMSIFQSAFPKWPLWLAIVLVAPIFEEVFFRGFLYKGLSNSILGVIGAILITNTMWTLLHVHYEPFFIGVIFILGLVFGWARYKTGSILVPIFLHVVNNSLAIVQLYFVTNV